MTTDRAAVRPSEPARTSGFLVLLAAAAADTVILVVCLWALLMANFTLMGSTPPTSAERHDDFVRSVVIASVALALVVGVAVIAFRSGHPAVGLAQLIPLAFAAAILVQVVDDRDDGAPATPRPARTTAPAFSCYGNHSPADPPECSW